MVMRKLCFLTAIASTLMFSGCVAVWGQAHNVVSANDKEFKIQYDKGLTSSARAAALAREHCNKFSKSAEPVGAEMPGILFGIIEETYACVDALNGRAK